MKRSLLKKVSALFLAVLMLLTMVPAGVFAAENDLPVMMATNAASSKGYYKYYKKIYTVTVLDEIKVEGEPLEQWDMSAAGDSSVWGWVYLNEEATAAAGDNRYDAYLAGDGGVAVHPNSTHLFYMFEKLVAVNNPENLKTSGVTSFKLMFSRCYDLVSVDMSSWDTSSVTNMSGIFDMSTNLGIVPALTSVDLTGWDTSNVTDMNKMFYNCSNLDNLDLSSFNTAKVTNMSNMFYRCLSLENIYIGDGWTVESVNSANAMFNCCYAIVGGKEIYDKEFQYGSPGIEYAKLREDGGFLEYKAPEAPEEYTVTYSFTGDVPEGVAAPEDARYEEGSTVTVADAPSADGYVFNGWTTTDADVENGEFTVNNDVSFTGEWSKLYKVEYRYTEGYPVPEDAPAEEMLGMLSSVHKAGDDVDKAWPLTANGYVFIGWTTEDADVAGDVFTMPENDVVFYGYFKKPVESVEFLNEGDVVLNEGGQTRLNVYIKPEDATVKTIIFETSDPDVATVDEAGNIIAVGEGEATITVKSADDETKSDTITVKVKKPVTEIGVTPAEVTLKKGETEKLTVYVNDDATNKDVTFESMDESVAKVDENGNIIAVGDGETTVTVTSKDDPTKKVTVKVTVKTPVTEIIAPEKIILEVDEEKELGAKVNDDATNKELLYDTSDPGIVKVDSDGNVIAVGEGTATITVISKDNSEIKKDIEVTVVKKYKVTYEIIGEVRPDGVAAPEEEKYNNGSTVDVEADLYAEGYDFSGWFTEDITVADGSFVIDRDVHFVGAFSKNVTDITVDKKDITLDEGGKDKITVTVSPDDATDKGVIYKSSNESVVRVDKNGNIEAVGEGEATITVTSKSDESISETITVTVKKPVVPVEGIVVNKSELVLSPGDIELIRAEVKPDNATDKGVIYKSSNESVVRVDENGNIEAVGEGEATITVTSKSDESISETITVTVKKPVVPVEEIVVNKSELVLNPGDIELIRAEVKPDNATDKGVIYKSSNESVVRVDENGNIEAVGEGEATITVTSKSDESISETITVTVKKPVVPVEEIVVNKSEFVLNPGDIELIRAEVKPNNATDKGVIFTSDNPDVATVDEKGNLTATGIGTATITVTSTDNPDIKKVITVTVEKPFVSVEGVETDRETITIRKGETDKITATVKPDDANNKELTYTSSKPDVVRVDENGNIEAVGEGRAIITVASKEDPLKRVQILVIVEKERVPVTSVEASKEEMNLIPGAYESIVVSVNPDDATDKSVTYTSSNPDVAKVDDKGNVVAVGEGEAIITITSKDDPTKSDTIKVTVKAPEEPENPDEPEKPVYTITVPDGMNILEGESKSLGVTITPDDGSIKPVYISSDESVVTVDADGNIRGIKAGAATISVDFGGGDIRVIPVVVAAIPAPPRKHHIAFGKTDGIGWYEVSVNGGDFFPQGPNSTLEVEEGSILVVRVQDMWIDDEFDFYVNGSKVPMDPANTITVVVDGYMLIGALSMDVEVPDVEESLTIFEKITNFFAKIINWFRDLFTW